jgi:hypothetical protein
LSIQVSPFYLQIAATGIPATTPLASILGASTRVLLILSSLALLATSLRPTVWWRSLVTWLSLASLTELFFSLLLLVHAGQTTLLTAYGTSPPMTGTISYPARIVGTDLNTYLNPSLTASFNLDFYLGLLNLTIVGASTALTMLHDRGLLVTTVIPGVREFFFTPPYRHAWLSTSDRDLNPLSQDPENTTDNQLLDSFGKIYRTIQPGGIINIILPEWASTISDRFQKLLTWTGFAVEEAGTVYRTPGKPETQLRFRKPLAPAELASQETEMAPTLSQTIETESSFPDVPQQLLSTSKPDWAPVKMTKQEGAMLRSAVSILSKHREPMPYRELLNQVYMELVERKVQFDSARQIESTLLKHDGRELVLTEESDEEGFKAVKKWSLGEEDLSPDRDGTSSILKRLSSHRPRVPPVMRLLRKWQRKPKYRRKPQRAEE